ncbi:cadherin repeat domain-containing protein, partial [Vibrio sonorensis]|uniref:cadherin repeat domain-containing protein n=1 Tax=Vibrio sonorensis TaxID=1004316 RepID=UPI000A89CB35
DSEGNISLTPAGVDAFTNDYETLGNNHTITVVASDGVNDTEITVTLNEEDVNEPPVFDPPEEGDEYVFNYLENSADGDVIGQVTASDPEGGEITYSISYGDDDPLDSLFDIDSEGNISLTPAGVDAFTNNYELLGNSHVITVVASDGVNETEISVTLNEQDVNEAPVAEDFDVDAGDAVIVPIVFDSDVAELDHISDEDDDFAGTQVNVMITSLPEYGTLLYTDEDGVTREITEDDLYTIGDPVDDVSKIFNPNNIVYVPGEGDPFEMGWSGDSDDIVLEDGFFNWGDYVSDTERVFTLDNGNTIGISITDNNDKPLMQYTNGQPHIGYGIGDIDGSGMNKEETLKINLINNPLTIVTLGLDGMGGSFVSTGNIYVEVTYHLADGTTHVEQYRKDEGDTGNQQILYEFTYSSPDNPIVGIDLSSNGGNWELRYLQGNEDITDDVTFDYVAVDSGGLTSEEATVTIDVDESPEYAVQTAADGDALEGQLGNDLMVGDDNDNVFVWLDSNLDTGTDVVMDFAEGDLIDVRDVLADDDDVDVADLDAIVDAAVVDGDVVLTVEGSDADQTIVIENGAETLSEFIAPDNSIDELALYAQILKTDAA